MTAWHSFHVHCHDETRHDELILDAVCPLLDRVSPHVEAGYFVRHWKRGPHLRIELKASGDLVNEVVEPALEEIVDDYLRAHPSTVDNDGERLLAVHQARARQELEDGPLVPWLPDNSVVRQPHDPRLHVLGSTEVVDLLADFRTAVHPLIGQGLRTIRDGGDRLMIAISLLFAAITVASGRAGEIAAADVVSFRSHAEGFLSQCPPAARADFDRQLDRNEHRIARRLGAVEESLTLGTAAPADVPWLVDWAGLLRGYRARVRHLLAAGPLKTTLTIPSPGPDEPAVPAWVHDSPFHALMYDNTAYRRLMGEDPGFLCLRMVLNLAYHLLDGLGIVPLQRYLLCHLAAGTVERVRGESTWDAVRAWVAAHPDPTPAG